MPKMVNIRAYCVFCSLLVYTGSYWALMSPIWVLPSLIWALLGLIWALLCLICPSLGLTVCNWTFLGHSASSSEQQINFYRRCVLSMCSWSASIFFSSEKHTSRLTAHAQYISSVEIYLLLTAGRTVSPYQNLYLTERNLSLT